MVYIILMIAAVAISCIAFFFHDRSRQTIRFYFVAVFYAASMVCFLLYLCKNAFHLSIFLEYFPMPRKFILDFFSLRISQLGILCFLNGFCTLFLACNVFFANTFLTFLRPGIQQAISWAAGIYFFLEMVCFNPYFYCAVYSLLYPRFFTSVSIETFFFTLSNLCNYINCFILIACVGTVILFTIRSSKIRLLRLSLLSVSISYMLLICSYIIFFNGVPGHLIKYSKAADIVTFLSFINHTQMESYRFLPYVVTVFFILFSISIFYLNKTRYKIENHNLEITQNIRAANMSSRIFCHYMKNEILAISAEVETLTVTPESREAHQNILDRCDLIYRKLDGIHKSIRDNVMNIRQVPIDEPVRAALKTVESSSRLNGVEILLHMPREIPEVLIDPVYFEQAVIEVFYNAGDAMQESEKKQLTIAINYGMRWVTLTISDTGCGIAEKDMPHIFTPLYSTHAMTKNWGIGLSITHRIITAFQGRVDVQSQPGHGTTFEILLPSATTGLQEGKASSLKLHSGRKERSYD